MRQRALSSIGVVAIGLVPALLGGWVFAVVFTAIAVVAYREAIAITIPKATPLKHVGSVLVALAAFLAALDAPSNAFALIASLAVGVPLIGAVFQREALAIEHWTATTATTLYLALPVYAAIDLRNTIDYPARDWIGSVVGVLPGVADATGGGLAWFLLALFITWLSDTFAYLVGKTWGKHKLIPRVSPNKTIEGALGGLAASAITAAICDQMFGMDIGIAPSIAIGLALGGIGQLGDLSESMLKRARGVKDSGNLIPGHGGMLDRIDALIFVIVAAWLIAPVV
ncbi:MAG: phosphatidate cytidylyltransferase [Chloroflexia bacterium]|nr:phosphatidate cytidylyltransferase [Chloroflexia bacterium]